MHIHYLFAHDHDETLEGHLLTALSDLITMGGIRMHATCLMGLARGPATCINHVASQAWASDPQL